MKKVLTFEQQKSFLDRDIKQALSTGLLLKVNLLTTGCCPECDKLTGQALTLGYILENSPLPHKDCIRATGCLCCYTFETMRDENGRLIRR